MKNWLPLFGAGGAKDNSPRLQPWVAGEKISSPGRGDRKLACKIFFRPCRGWDCFCSETHGFTVGYFRPQLRSFNLILVLVGTFFFAGSILAAEIPADFAAANKLYAEGKFSDAAAGYEKILQTGVTSPALRFNHGNAEFKSGHVGQAIAAYRQAAQLAPRDAEIRANLAFVRNQVQGTTAHESRWQSWVGTLTLNEGAVLTAVLLWLTFALLIARQIRPALVPKLRGLTRLSVLVTICSLTVLGLQAAGHFSSATAVVVADNVTARSGPFDDAQSAFVVRDGAELSILDRRDDWVQVADGTGKSGWLPAKQVEVIPGA
jgi:tetratricopeptide (TPR) repeat protein